MPTANDCTLLLSYHHIETHSAGFAPADTANRQCYTLNHISVAYALNVFLYGRGVRERSEFYRLKAGYFTLKFHPHMVHSLRIELS